MGTDNNKTMPQGLTRRERRVYACLMDGGKWSATELTINTYCSSPRNAIMEMRHKGITIHDEWRNHEDGRHKVYYI